MMEEREFLSLVKNSGLPLYFVDNSTGKQYIQTAGQLMGKFLNEEGEPTNCRISYVEWNVNVDSCFLDVISTATDSIFQMKMKLADIDHTVVERFYTKEEQFIRELKSLLNRYSKENGSNTPDFILAGYIEDCLRAFNSAVGCREKWYGRMPVFPFSSVTRELK